jgi:hypothetical protein
VQLLPDPPMSETKNGAIAQLGERLVCNQKVTGSIPVGSTNFESLTTCNQEFIDDALEARLLFNNPKVFLF